MIAVDINILVYSHREDSEFHAPAAGAIRDLAESGRLWSIPWPAIHEFLAIVTHPRIYSPPTPLPDALRPVPVFTTPGSRQYACPTGWMSSGRRTVIFPGSPDSP